METYRVRIARDGLIVSVSHFIAYDGEHCERLHGHDYRVAVELTAGLGENKLVYDFVVLDRLLEGILARIDHRTLLPLRSPHFGVEERESSVRVTFGEKEWIFPREDCALLPLVNTTAEELAAWIGANLRKELAGTGLEPPVRLVVEVGESTGYSAIFEDDRSG